MRSSPSAPATTGPGEHVELERDLRDAVRGEARFDAGTRALYAATDGSNYRQVPIGVVVPRDVDDVVAAVATCRNHDAPVLPRGGATGLAGQTTNAAVMLDLSKHVNRVLEVDAERRLARVQPGTILDHLQVVAERDGLTFGPDPSTHAYCTFGGMIGNNACGVHSVMSALAGTGARTSDNVETLDVLTYEGQRLTVGPTADADLERIVTAGDARADIYRRLRELRDRHAAAIRERYPDIPRRVSGYNLDELLPERGFHVARALAGTEGTCVTLLEATVRLVESPPARALVLVAFPDVYEAADHVPELMRLRPLALEGFDDVLVDDMRRKRMHLREMELLPEGGGWLIVELGGENPREAAARAREVAGPFGDRARVVENEARQEDVWRVREGGLGATAHVPGKPLNWEGWEDSAVPPERLGTYLRDLRRLYEQYGYDGAFYGHFGQGCLHTRVSFDLKTEPGIARFRAFLEDAADLVVSHGGSLSGEHGDGQARGALLTRMFGEELVGAFRDFKAIWDPRGRMNPGKVVDADPVDRHLRLGTAYRPMQDRTHFSFAAEGGSLEGVALRCVGIGVCRRTEDGTMCPSYMVTREEKHTTRGRARMLYEMTRGETITDGWRSEEVEDALHLCLSCKGCRTDCPVSVDMATYKAEFLSHHYEGRLRPRPAYAMGLIYWWARIASRLPRLANFVAHAPVLGNLLKRAGGIAVERDAPRFAEETLKRWFRDRGRRVPGGRTVIVWPDTFTNFLEPDAGRAAVEVLERLGYQPVMPAKALCCGRPLYDYGMLDLAKRQLRQILRALRAPIRAGVPVVGVEPSCVAVFRDELVNLFPDDADARRLSEQTYTLGEFLDREGVLERLPTLERSAIVHGHCHHKSVMGFESENRTLDALGLEHEILDAGCCGMAGSFGFEAGERYEVAVKAGERVLLPKVRQADEDTLIVTDGFSCRTQIAQGTGRRAVHLAEVILAALRRDEGPA